MKYVIAVQERQPASVAHPARVVPVRLPESAAPLNRIVETRFIKALIDQRFYFLGEILRTKKFINLLIIYIYGNHKEVARSCCFKKIISVEKASNGYIP